MCVKKVESIIKQLEFPLATPKIGLSMLYAFGEAFEKMVEEIPKTNTRYIELVDDGPHALDKQRVAALKGVSESYDVDFTVHAPFTGINIVLRDKPLLDATMKRMKESIINSAALDCRLWVFHPGTKTVHSMFDPDAEWARNLESVRLLVKFAEEHGVKGAIENIMEPCVLRSVGEFQRFYGEVDEDVGLVLDTGHANLSGELESYLTELPDKLVHVHAQDNLGERDQHLGIGYGNVNWENFAGLLKKACFDGIVVVESVEHIEESMQKLRQLLQ
jgi:sugar phosphate isomerase/epimerase